MSSASEFSGFSPAVDPQEQVDRAMTLLGRRSDLQGRLRINPVPARKRQAGAWSVFGFRGYEGDFNESPHLLLHVTDIDVGARVILPNKARGGLWTRLRSANLAHLVSRVLREMAPAMARCPGMEPRLILKQRHWRTRNGPSFRDAGVRSKPRPAVWDRVCEALDLTQIRSAVRHRLMARAATAASA